MKRMPLREALRKRNDIVKSILSGSVFVYPTDTVYGIGCDAANQEAVARIRKIKRTSHPFSVIAPSREWIKENMEIKKPFEKYLDFLPGPYTLILKVKGNIVSENVSYSGKLGIRIPRHPLTELIQESGTPFVTTSCNISGEETISSVAGIPVSISGKADFIIDAGRLGNQASSIIDLTGSRPKRIR
ncbi:MAG: threonylcarbamoyl-AMP synthase [Candidatus Aenigmarchaeota archaeon]|nr:threonylcarbamoyl-AMP synthase [Candidatus Aenigmarchaeota archaeon]